MSRLFWIMAAIMGGALLLLIVNHDSGTTMGMESGRFGSAVVLALWGALIASAFLARGVRLRDTLRQAVIWLAVILVLMAGYVLRYELQDIGSTVTAGLIPGSPLSRTGDDGLAEVTLFRSPNGHFEANAQVNGADVRFIVDTGATGIVLTADDARRAGLNPASLAYTVLTRTANGTGRAARARIDTLDMGAIRRRNSAVLVAEPDRLATSLLGQSFLESIQSYERRGDRLTLRD